MKSITTIGLDIAKQVFQVHGADNSGRSVLRRKLRRGEMIRFFAEFAEIPPCLIGIEASGSAHYWARTLGGFGHTVRLMAPQFVKPYVKSQKNDGGDLRGSGSTSDARSTLADANDAHDWRIYADFAQVLIALARTLYAAEPMGVELDQSLYVLYSTTIVLCLSLFPWARFRRRKAAEKICAAISQCLSTSPMARCTTSTCSTRSCPRPVRSMSWIAAISTSNASIASRWSLPSS